MASTSSSLTLRRLPLLPVALAVVAGILLAHYMTALTPIVWAVAMALCCLLTGSCLLLRFRGHTALAVLAAVLLAGALAGLLEARSMERRWDLRKNLNTQSHTMLLVVRETPQPRERSVRARAEVVSLDGHAVRGPLTLYLRPDTLSTTVAYGDRLLLHGYPDSERRSVYVTSDHYLIVSHDSTSLRASAERLRMRLLGRLQSGPLQGAPLALAEAITLGWRADIDNDTGAAFRGAGIAHLLAVSGLHVGLLAAIVGFLLLWLGRDRKGRVIRGAVQLASVWLFVLLAGMAPSALRAALMFSLFIVADMMGRRTPRLNLLAAAAIAMLLVDTGLLFDVGWQLSFSAVAGILLARPVTGLFHSRLWRVATTSVAATLATLPVVLATFHAVPLYFLIANCLIVPLASLMLLLSLLYLALPCTFLYWLAKPVLAGVEWLASLVASLPGAIVSNLNPSPLHIALATAVILILLVGINFVPLHTEKNI